jgi:CheY-like chemotaxis protein
VADTAGAVLLVEDSADDALLMQRAFEASPSAPLVHWVDNGNDAILYLCREGRFADRGRYPLPSLILLDLKMPVKNGFEVLRWARSYPAFATIPIVVLSDCHDTRIVRRAYELGANSFLRKPHSCELRIVLIKALQDYWLLANMTAPCLRDESPAES